MEIIEIIYHGLIIVLALLIIVICISYGVSKIRIEKLKSNSDKFKSMHTNTALKNELKQKEQRFLLGHHYIIEMQEALNRSKNLKIIRKNSVYDEHKFSNSKKRNSRKVDCQNPRYTIINEEIKKSSAKSISSAESMSEGLLIEDPHKKSVINFYL